MKLLLYLETQSLFYRLTALLNFFIGANKFVKQMPENLVENCYFLAFHIALFEVRKENEKFRHKPLT